MGKSAISVTLGADNLTWLKARVGATGARSVSELLDRLVTDARTRGSLGPVRSVVGTIDLDPGDPLLEEADAAVAQLFERSLGRPMLVKEAATGRYGTRRPARKRTRG
jgi:hypothetical protein